MYKNLAWFGLALGTAAVALLAYNPYTNGPTPSQRRKVKNLENLQTAAGLVS